MNIVKIIMVSLLGLGLGYVVGVGLENKSTTCTALEVIRIGGCDGAGLCRVIVSTEDEELYITKAPYPIAGAVYCKEAL